MSLYTKEKNQETILAIVLGLLVIGFLTKINILNIISISLIIVSLFFNSIAGYITWVWLKFSHMMGWVMSKVLLSVIFYLFLFPIALLARLFKKDDLQLKKTTHQTYYSVRNHMYIGEDLKNPW
jgi:hypothetical protein